MAGVEGGAKVSGMMRTRAEADKWVGERGGSVRVLQQSRPDGSEVVDVVVKLGPHTRQAELQNPAPGRVDEVLVTFVNELAAIEG